MKEYRADYAYYGDITANPVPIPDILDFWEESKQDLFTLLGNQLIYSQEINYERTERDLQKSMEDMISWKHKTYGRAQRSGYKFVDNLHIWLNNSSLSHDTRVNIRQLVSACALAKNEYSWRTFEIPMLNEKSYKVQKGCKPLKALARIASAYNIEGFEDFRICHSLILNDKHLKGNLCLSIHPLDYWTMSDNNITWHSCMSWTRQKEYRQGTIEMMNSPMVVVAYLTSSEPYEITYGEKWNNKKWRQLFIVSPECIMGITGYPYENKYLTQFITKKLAVLAKENLGWNYDSELYEYSNGKVTNSIGEMIREIHFSTHLMYLDLNEFIKYSIYTQQSKEALDICYSGKSMCVNCGCEEISEPCMLCCSNCDAVQRCVECGDIITDEDNMYYVNDQIYCSCCFEEKANFCGRCGEGQLLENLYKFHLMYADQDEMHYFLDPLYLCQDCWEDFTAKHILYEDVSSNIVVIYWKDLKNDPNYQYLLPYHIRRCNTDKEIAYSCRYHQSEILDEIQEIN